MNDTTTRKRHDETFKRSAVERLLVSGKSTRVIAQELGVNLQSLQKWKEKFKALPAGQVAGTLAALQAENRRLPRELHRAAQQRDILKPWASAPHPRGTFCEDRGAGSGA